MSQFCNSLKLDVMKTRLDYRTKFWILTILSYQTRSLDCSINVIEIFIRLYLASYLLYYFGTEIIGNHLLGFELRIRITEWIRVKRITRNILQSQAWHFISEYICYIWYLTFGIKSCCETCTWTLKIYY